MSYKNVIISRKKLIQNFITLRAHEQTDTHNDCLYIEGQHMITDTNINRANMTQQINRDKSLCDSNIQYDHSILLKYHYLKFFEF